MMRKSAFRYSKPVRVEDDLFPGGRCFEFTLFRPDGNAVVRVGGTQKQATERAKKLTVDARRRYYGSIKSVTARVSIEQMGAGSLA